MRPSNLFPSHSVTHPVSPHYPSPLSHPSISLSPPLAVTPNLSLGRAYILANVVCMHVLTRACSARTWPRLHLHLHHCMLIIMFTVHLFLNGYVMGMRATYCAVIARKRATFNSQRTFYVWHRSGTEGMLTLRAGSSSPTGQMNRCEEVLRGTIMGIFRTFISCDSSTTKSTKQLSYDLRIVRAYFNYHTVRNCK